MASAGKVNHSIVHGLVEMFPYNNGKPFGLSNATVQNTWINYLTTSIENPVDLLASTSEAIAKLVVQHISPMVNKQGKILVTGGGAHNLHLIKRIEALSKEHGLTIDVPANVIIDYKECLLMAYLGYLTMQGKAYGINDLTGATTDTIGGALFKALR
jgi:anhydro-N-acetylmuramic acid kinase